MEPASDFLDAVRGGRAVDALRLLEEHPELAKATAGGASPVLLALFSGHEELAGLLAERAGSIGLDEAAALGSVDALRTAFADARASGEAAPLGVTGPLGWTPLHLAAYLGRREAVAWLLSEGADAAAVSDNREANTPLHAALAGAQEPGVIAALLDGGADPGARGGLGWTPLHLAASRGNEGAVDTLLERGARPVAADDGRRPSAIAAERGHPALAARLEALEAR